MVGMGCVLCEERKKIEGKRKRKRKKKEGEMRKKTNRKRFVTKREKKFKNHLHIVRVIFLCISIFEIKTYFFCN